MDIDYTVGEVELSYKPKFKNIYKVVSSEDAYKYLLPTYKEVALVENIRLGIDRQAILVQNKATHHAKAEQG